ncbi:MAG: aspartate-semialdehyde dehydrogenase [Balneolales bacterium]
MPSYRVGILGATGAVGQKFVHLLKGHPWFSIVKLGASERSAGKPYKEACNWIETSSMPEDISRLLVSNCQASNFQDVDFVFSGLDANVATDIETEFAKAGIPVISNAKNYREHPKVPLLVPEVNPEHVELIKHQTFDPQKKGFIATNPNCVCVPLTMALKPLSDAFGIDSVIMTTLQAVSGAGYPGVSSLDILGNVMPYISGEEDKIGIEPLKILGELEDDQITPATFPVQSTAIRVPVIDGHLLSVSVKLTKDPGSIDEVRNIINNWENPLEGLNLPTAPGQPLKLYDDFRYPQPRKHALAEGGMQIGMGRLRRDDVMDIAFTVLGHNTIRGAAGCAILNAELLVNKNFL